MTKKQDSALLSVLDNYGGHPFDDAFDAVFPVYGPNEVEAALGIAEKLVMVIWGGADISPAIYGQKAGKWCFAKDTLSNRDHIEVGCAQKAIQLGIPIIGICRGAQLMCALSGGKLVQDVTGHAGGWHEIVTNDGRKFACPSLHHQMMWPWGIEKWEMVANIAGARSRYYRGEPDENWEPTMLTLPGPEPEIIWIPGTKSLCIQSHPEFIHDKGHPFVTYCNELVAKYCLITEGA